MTKLLARNSPALLRTISAAGNPVSSRPEAGVGNCFPGLEADLRNLERRFFPYLAFDFIGPWALLAGVDLAGVSSKSSAAELPRYQELALELQSGQLIVVSRLSGVFGSLGQQQWRPNVNDPNLPEDAWSVVRLLSPGPVELELGVLDQQGVSPRVTLRGQRLTYFESDGSLNPLFQAGELSQSLCSPWTHDFRDCGCWYWASNHPDIAEPAMPLGVDGEALAYEREVPWLRGDRRLRPAPDWASENGDREREMDHHEINGRWQELDFVVDGREQRGSYEAGSSAGMPLPDLGTLGRWLGYAAAVEHGVMLEYLTAAFSVDRAAGNAGSEIRQDAEAIFAELVRVAVGEMRHLRLVNDVLRELHQVGVLPGDYSPVLGLPAKLPSGGGNSPRDMLLEPLSQAALDRFLAIERPNFSVDSLYARIRATLVAQNLPRTSLSLIDSVIAEGSDHYETFRFVDFWFKQHDPADLVLDVSAPDPANPRIQAFRAAYHMVLEKLHAGYSLGVPAGANEVLAARSQMLDGAGGLLGACNALAQNRELLVWVPPDDPRFASVDVP